MPYASDGVDVDDDGTSARGHHQSACVSVCISVGRSRASNPPPLPLARMDVRLPHSDAWHLTEHPTSTSHPHRHAPHKTRCHRRLRRSRRNKWRPPPSLHAQQRRLQQVGGPRHSVVTPAFERTHTRNQPPSPLRPYKHLRPANRRCTTSAHDDEPTDP